MKVSIIVGHSFKDKGAYNPKFNISEWDYNNLVALNLKSISKHDIEIVYRDCKYSELPAKVDKIQSDINISLHCNAYNSETSGSEVLSSGSKESLKLANLMQKEILNVFNLNDRGVKIRKTGRGAPILMKTKAPTILLEPFFIDNNSDIEIGLIKILDYVNGIEKVITAYEKERE